MLFVPYVFGPSNRRVPVSIAPMKEDDAEQTNCVPMWQTSWTSEYLSDARFEKYAAKVGNELIALGAYEILKNSLVVHIAYIEAQPQSKPTMDGKSPKYTGIGRMLIALGVKLSMDHGFGGDIVLEAKTPELAKHYVEDFGAVALPSFSSSAPRFIIADEAAKTLFFNYLE